MISVIVPTYNSAKTVHIGLASLLKQTFKDFEIIVVDDCSTDNTVETVKKISDTIKVVQLKKNIGAGPARNEGIKAAKGDYIAFLDSDDFYEPGRLAYMWANKGNFDVIRTERIIYNVDRWKKRSKNRPYGPAYSFMCKKKFLIDNNIWFSNRRRGEDSDFRRRLQHANATWKDLPYEENTNYCLVQRLGSLSEFEWKNDDKYKAFCKKIYGHEI